MGELYAEINGEQEPVLVSLELLPEKKLKIRDFAIITSAYYKEKLQNYINENSILYIDPNKKRTNSWLSRTRLQLPVGENQRGSIRSIAYADGKVKIQNPIHMTQMQEKLYKAGIIDEYGNTIADSGKFSKDDTIYDLDDDADELLFTSDGDLLFDAYGTNAGKVINVEQLMQEQGAEQAIYTLYNAAARTAERKDFDPHFLGKVRKEKRPDIDRDDVVFSDSDVSMEIVTLDDGKQYVQANRQVLTGNDSVQWKKQIEQYINRAIRRNKDIILPTSDGRFLILTERSAYKLSDNHISEIAKTVERFLSDEQYHLKGEVAAHIDELVEVAQFVKYQEDKNNKHENDIGEDGFNYYSAFFMDNDGKYYKVYFSSAINEQDETVYSIGDIRKRRFPNRKGSSSDNEALKNGRKSSNSIIYTTEDKSQEVKTAVQLAFEKAFKKGERKQIINPSTQKNHDSGKFSKDDTIIDPDELDEELLFTSDGGLSFDGYGTSAGKVINVEQLMQEQGAEQAIYTLYNAAARTAERKDFDPHFLGKVRKEKRPDIDRDDVVFAEGGVSYEIGISEDNEQIVIVKDNILQGVPKKDWVKTVKANMKNKFSKGIPYKGKLFLVNKDTRREFTNSKYSKAIRNKSFYKDKMKASNHLNEIIIASTNYINEDLNHQRKDSIVQFARGDITMKIGNHGYEAKILVGFTKDGELLLYDIINMIPKKITIKKGTKTVPVHQQGGSNSSQSVPSGTNIAQSNQNSNPSAQNNLNDSDGKFSKDDTIYEEPYNQYSMVRQQKKNRLRHCRPDML